jgi:hypothetical protein
MALDPTDDVAKQAVHAWQLSVRRYPGRRPPISGLPEIGIKSAQVG